MNNRSPLGPQPCEHCDTPLLWPRWTPCGDGEYFALCSVCRQAVEWGFTAEQAIADALAIIAAHQRRPAVQR